MSYKRRSGSYHSYHSEGEESPEGGWLVSYADMMTLLFGFFAILYTFSQVDQERLSSFGKEVAEAFGGAKNDTHTDSDEGLDAEARQLRALQMLVTVLNLGESVDSAVAKIEQVAAESKSKDAMAAAISKSLGKSDKFELQKQTGDGDLDRSVKLAIPAEMLFSSGSDQLKPTSVKTLREIAGRIRNFSELMALDIVGHTDTTAVPSGSRFKDNYALSAARASAVASVLVASGLASVPLNVVGMGASKPLFPEVDPQGHVIAENRSKNRRVEIIVRREAATQGAR